MNLIEILNVLIESLPWIGLLLTLIKFYFIAKNVKNTELTTFKTLTNKMSNLDLIEIGPILVKMSRKIATIQKIITTLVKQGLSDNLIQKLKDFETALTSQLEVWEDAYKTT